MPAPTPLFTRRRFAFFAGGVHISKTILDMSAEKNGSFEIIVPFFIEEIYKRVFDGNNVDGSVK